MSRGSCQISSPGVGIPTYHEQQVSPEHHRPHRSRLSGFRNRTGIRRFVVTPTAQAQSQSAKPATPPAAAASSSQPDRAGAYYHYMLAHEYEDMANTYGRPEYATRAIEEYKLALDADPTSKFLTSGLAELYFRTGRVRDAVLAAQEQIKKDPNNLEAHKLLGNIYLRSLGDDQQSGPSEEMLKLAIAEYTKIVSLEPESIQDHLLLGQLYSFAHDSVRAEEQFSIAEKIDPGSEETALNLARLYTEQGDPNRAIKVLNNFPEDDKTGKTEFVLGASYERLKDTQHAIKPTRRLSNSSRITWTQSAPWPKPC